MEFSDWPAKKCNKTFDYGIFIRLSFMYDLNLNDLKFSLCDKETNLTKYLLEFYFCNRIKYYLNYSLNFWQSIKTFIFEKDRD